MNKGSVLVIFALLIMSVFSSIDLFQVHAQTNVETSVMISVEPNPAQANQPVQIVIKVSPPPPHSDFFSNITVTLIRPDGYAMVNIYQSTPEGSYRSGIYLGTAGTWVLRVTFSGQVFANGTIQYLPSENQTTFTRLPAPSPSPTSPPWSNMGSWTQKVPLPTPRASLGAALVNGKIYAIGGSTLNGGGGNQNGPLPTSGGVVGTNEEYDPITNTWTSKASMPIPMANFGIAVFENKIYCIGGDVNEVYDPKTDKWENRTPMSTPRTVLQANIVNDKFYLIGGYAPDNSSLGTATSALNEAYDPATDIWTKKASSLYMTYGYASAVFDDKIYIFCGSKDGLKTTINQIYDTKTDTWTLGSSAPTYFMSGFAVSTTGVAAPKRIYIFDQPATDIAAYPDAPLYTDQIYDPKTDSWMAGADLTTGRQDFAIATVNDTFYVIGGRVFTYSGIYSIPYGPSVTPVATNEQYIPEDYGIPDPTYQTPYPSSSPSLSPTSAATPTPTPTSSEPPSPSASFLPSASEQPTRLPERIQSFPVEYVYAIAVIVAIATIVAMALILRRRK